MEPKHSRRIGLPFLAAGVTFLVLGFAGKPAFVGVGLGLVGVGVAFSLRGRAD